MDSILAKLDASPRPRDGPSFSLYPRQKSTIPRRKSGSDLRSNSAKNNSAQSLHLLQELLIPINNSPPAASSAEEQINTRLTSFENTMAQSMAHLEQVNNNVRNFQSMVTRSPVQQSHDYYHPGSF